MRLNHILVVADDLEAMRSFFVNTIGLTDGDRPAFGFPGHWLYDEDHAVIHLAGGKRSGEGIVDHVAFDGDDYDGLVSRLDRDGVNFNVAVVPQRGDRQVFADGPEGLKVEIGFPAE